MVSPEELVGPDRERQRWGAEAVDVDAAKDSIMVRSEERLAVDTQRVVIGRARLRKYQVTEEQQITVTVAHEQVRVEHDTDVAQHAHDGAVPGSGRGAAESDTVGAPAAGTDDLDRAGRERWMVLYAQRPVVTMESVAVERVRLSTVAVTAQQTVTGAIRQEQLEVVTEDAAARGVTGQY